MLRSPVSSHFSWRLFLAALCAAWFSGCSGSSDGPTRYRIDGTVQFDNKPVPAGTIYFDPDTTKGNKGPQAYAQIVDGKYDTDKGGKGHTGGAMKVRIVGLSAPPAATSNDDSPKPPLFPEFVDAIQLETKPGSRNFSIPSDYAGAPVGGPAQGGP
jgi:hypothetical protein